MAGQPGPRLQRGSAPARAAARRAVTLHPATVHTPPLRTVSDRAPRELAGRAAAVNQE